VLRVYNNLAINSH